MPSIAERAAKALRGAKPVDVTLGPVNVFPDALILEVHDDGGLKEIRRALEAATRTDAFGFEESTFLPHTTIATFTDASAADALREALPPLRERAGVPMRVARIELTRWWLTGVDLTDPPEADVLRSYALRG